MTEEQDLLSQVERAKKLFEELKKEMNNSFNSKEVNEETRNLTEEILVKLRICLDKTLCYKLKKISFSGDLSRVGFPISKDELNFNSLIKSYGLEVLSQLNPRLINLIKSAQPFSSGGNKYFEILHEKGAKEKHQFLINEIKETTHVKTTLRSPGGEVSWSKRGVHFGRGVYINGVPINPATQEPAFVPPTHQLIRHYQVIIKLSDKNIEVSSLCDSLIKSVDKIVKEIIALK